jgi:hypothetical protein
MIYNENKQNRFTDNKQYQITVILISNGWMWVIMLEGEHLGKHFLK